MSSDKPRDLSPEGLAAERADYELFQTKVREAAVKMITPEKLFLVVKKTVLSLGMSDLIGLGMSNPKAFADLSPELKAAFEKAAAELSE